MALCQFEDQFHMFDVTPVENLFIEEYMLRAPGDFVKVYIYGLKQCYRASGDTSPATMARALGMEESTVLNAFSYWERQGILRRVQDNPPTYRFFNVKRVMLGKEPESDELYRYRDFNQSLQSKFGGRLLHPQEYTKAIDWIETMNLPIDVILFMVETTVRKRGARVTFSYLDKVAATWSSKGVRTIEEAEQWTRQDSEQYHCARKVLHQMGLKRSPSVDEEQMSNRWMAELGFSLDAMLFACRELTKIQNPNFAYLDKVLISYAEKGIKTAAQMETYANERTNVRGSVREVLAALGIKDVGITDDSVSLYDGWLEMGFSHEALITVAKQCARANENRLQDVDRWLHLYYERGMLDVALLQQEQRQTQDQQKRMYAVFEKAGESRAVTLADTRLLDVWTQELSMPYDVVLVAAQCASTARNKVQYMDKVIRSWAETNRRTLAEVLPTVQAPLPTTAAQPSTTPLPQKRLSKPVTAQNFSQREYREEDLTHIVADAGSWGGGVAR